MYQWPHTMKKIKFKCKQVTKHKQTQLQKNKKNPELLYI